MSSRHSVPQLGKNIGKIRTVCKIFNVIFRRWFGACAGIALKGVAVQYGCIRADGRKETYRNAKDGRKTITINIRKEGGYSDLSGSLVVSKSASRQPCRA